MAERQLGSTGAGTPNDRNRAMIELQNMETVSQIVDQVQTQYLGHALQSILGASSQSDPHTVRQQQLLLKIKEVQQPQQALLAQQQPTQHRLEMPKQRERAQQAHEQQMQQNTGNTMLARASSTGAQMQGLATQQPQQQARPQMMVPTSLATNNQERPGTAGAAAELQNSVPSSAPVATAAPTEPLDETRSILSRRSIQNLFAQIAPGETLDPDVEDAMMEIADEFVESVTSFASKLAKHRKSDVLEVKDVTLHLEKEWNIKVPGFGGHLLRPYKRPRLSEAHKQRLDAVRRSAAADQAEGDDTESISLLASASASENASTPVKPADTAAASPSPSP